MSLEGGEAKNGKEIFVRKGKPHECVFHSCHGTSYSYSFCLPTDGLAFWKSTQSLAIQHCGLTEDERELSELSFFSAKVSFSQSFKQLDGGVVSIHSSYSSIQQNHFCRIYAAKSKETKQLYCAHLYHTVEQNYDWRYYLAITQDLEAHITVSLMCKQRTRL